MINPLEKERYYIRGSTLLKNILRLFLRYFSAVKYLPQNSEFWVR